jgi:hypothetical protein
MANPAAVCSKRLPSQAMGDNVVELIVEYSRALGTGEHLDSREDKLIFWDFLGLVMVCLSPYMPYLHCILSWL